jgi:hypothetical protein
MPPLLYGENAVPAHRRTRSIIIREANIKAD